MAEIKGDVVRDKKQLKEADNLASESGAHYHSAQETITSVLIVDKQAQSYDAIIKVLKPLGYQIKCVDSREELFNKLKRIQLCTVVLTESFVLNAAKKNTKSFFQKKINELVGEIKSAFPTVNIIFAANQNDKALTVDALNAGVDDCLIRDNESHRFSSQLTESLNKIRQRKVFLSRRRVSLDSLNQMPVERRASTKTKPQNESLYWLDAIPGCAMIVTPELKMLGVNTRCEKLLGYLPNELNGYSLTKLLPQKLFAELTARVNSSTNFPRDIQGNTVTELVAIKADGVGIPVRCLIKKVELEEKARYILNIEDISQSMSTKADQVYLDNWQQLVGDYSRKLITLPVNQFQGVVERLLVDGAKLIACQRVTLYQINEKRDRAQLIFEWTENNSQSLKTYSERIDFSLKMLEVNQLLEGKKQILFPMDNVEKTQLDLCLGLSEHLAQVNSYSSYLIPMLNQEEVFAWIGFDFQYPSRCWQQGEIDRLDNLADLINRALLRKKYEELRRLTHIKLIETHGRLSKQACLDGLTKLANRRYFDRILEAEIRRATRDKSCLSVLFCDVDYFKNYNDHYGHIAGDICLKTISRNFEESFKRAGDFVARYGGEEFAVILPGLDCQNAFNAADNMRKRLSDLSIPHENSPLKKITISVGLTCMKAPTVDQQELILRRADKALYRAKEKGRNRVFVYDRLRASK
ncbi:sensor domain-containing diguanylate cyclase [Aliikangiella coralliicola]|uniref:diguanylate cyclase n=1 Tax=Aliikangiella coralliicola TaxID=2592383 RepID=A0A545UDI4_9GAMM|nr:diguanylate cyclase [Aliikangiella coralliicola]TQV87519.1 diguanylate cyclase [Aliikangiella coralliicola]